jgi:hypothetical protein
MKIWFSIKITMLSVMMTLFFVGIILSGGSLLLIAVEHPGVQAYQACVAAGVTFMTGIFSLVLATSAKDPMIVYRERVADKIRSSEITGTRDGGALSAAAIDALSGKELTPQDWINELSVQLQAGQTALYVIEHDRAVLKYGYAISRDKFHTVSYPIGEGIVGRVATEGRPFLITSLPPGYITVFSGLGSASPENLALIPVKQNDKVVAIIEIAAFFRIDKNTMDQIEQASRHLPALLNQINRDSHV